MEFLIAECSGEYPTTSYAPITLARITPLVGMPPVYAALDEVINPRSWLLPRFPNAHAQTATKPLVYGRDLAAHIGITEVFRPALQIVPQGCLALFVAHAVTS